MYARTDIGGAYRMNPDASWTPLLDWVDNAQWDYWGCDALATDPVDPCRLYLVGNGSMQTSESNLYSDSPYMDRLLGCTPTRMTRIMGRF